MKHTLTVAMILWTSLAMAQFNGDSTIMLPSVTVVDQGNPAQLFVDRAAEAYPDWMERQPENIEYYLSKSNLTTGKMYFESLNRVHLNKPPFQEILAIDLHRAKNNYDLNTVQVSASITVGDRSPLGNFSRGDLPKEAQFEFSHWSLLEGHQPSYSIKALTGLFAPLRHFTYQYTLLGEYQFQGSQFAEIKFAPKAVGKPGWTGILTLNTTENRAVKIEATLEKPLLEGVDAYEVSCLFSTGLPFYMKEMRIEEASGEDTLVLAWNIHKVNSPTAPTKKPKMLVAQMPEPGVQDASFWSNYRPKDEKTDKWIARTDSIIRYENSDVYLDSMDAIYNKFHWYEPLFSGIGYRKRSAGKEYYISPMVTMLQYGVGGIRYVPTALYRKRFSNYQSLQTLVNVNYGNWNKDLKGGLDLTYTYAPMHNGSVQLKVADNYTQITQNVDLAGIFSQSNLIQKTTVEAYHRYEWFNGFYTRFGLEYSQRRSLEGIDAFPLWDSIFGVRNIPIPFETYTVAMASVEFLIRPYQRYYLKGREKIVLSSRWPDLRFRLYQGLPGLFGSTVSFTKYTFEVDDRVRWGKLGETFYRAESGGFLTNTANVRFVEHKWFRGGDFGLFTHPIYTYQSLPKTFSSPSPYYSAWAIHHFNGALTNAIPLVRALGITTAVAGSALFVPGAQVQHVEGYVGLERQVVWWKQPLRFGVYRSVWPSSLPSGFQWKMSLDFKDTFYDRWNY